MFFESARAMPRSGVISSAAVGDVSRLILLGASAGIGVTRGAAFVVLAGCVGVVTGVVAGRPFVTGCAGPEPLCCERLDDFCDSGRAATAVCVLPVDACVPPAYFSR